jgi:hypothetical protein
MDSEIEAFVTEFGEYNRKIIEDAMAFRRRRLAEIQIDEPFDNHEYIKNILGHVVGSSVPRQE